MGFYLRINRTFKISFEIQTTHKMKTKFANNTQMYLLASAIMALLSGVVIVHAMQLNYRLNIFENGIVAIPFINMLLALLAIPGKIVYKDLFKKHAS